MDNDLIKGLQLYYDAYKRFLDVIDKEGFEGHKDKMLRALIGIYVLNGRRFVEACYEETSALKNLGVVYLWKGVDDIGLTEKGLRIVKGYIYSLLKSGEIDSIVKKYGKAAYISLRGCMRRGALAYWRKGNGKVNGYVYAIPKEVGEYFLGRIYARIDDLAERFGVLCAVLMVSENVHAWIIRRNVYRLLQQWNIPRRMFEEEIYRLYKLGIASEFKEDDGLFTVLNRKKLEGYLEREFEGLCV